MVHKSGMNQINNQLLANVECYLYYHNSMVSQYDYDKYHKDLDDRSNHQKNSLPIPYFFMNTFLLN